MMRVLLLSVDLPRETGTGSIVRTWYFVKNLAFTVSLDVLLFAPMSQDEISEFNQLPCRVVSSSSATEGAGLSRSPRAYKSQNSLFKSIISSILRPFKDWMLPFLKTLERVERSLESTGNRLSTRLFLVAALGVMRCQLWVGELLGLAAPAICVQNYDGFILAATKLNAKGPLEYDCIWFEHTTLFPLAEIIQRRYPNATLVCNSHNIEHQLATRLALNEADKRLPHSLTRIIRNIRLVEKAALGACRLTLVCSDADRSRALELCQHARVYVAPNGVDLNKFKSPASGGGSDGRTLIFTGGLNYKPNLDGIKFFLSHIFPIIQQLCPSVHLIVAGRMAHAEMAKANCSLAGIEVISDPIDMVPIFDRASVAVVPLLSGGGTRLKILEAMAMRVPVVSTSVGAEGVPYQNGRHLFIADDPHEFARAVARLLNDPYLRTELSLAARDFVVSGYDWPQITSLAIEHTLSVVAQANTPPYEQLSA